MSGLYPRGRAGARSRSRLGTLMSIALLALAVLAPALAAQPAMAAGSPNGDAAAPWPPAWNAYRYSDGTLIGDNNTDQNPSSLDLASGTCAGNCVGPESSVQYASDGTTAFFRIRVATDIADATKGGLVGGAFLTQIAVNDVVKAVVGVDGKSPSVDYVYVSDSVGGVVTEVYEYPFDSSDGESSAGMRVVSAGDGTGQYFLDFQVPLSVITTASSGAITESTGVKLYYGSSAAANLATINKDFMAGDVTAVDFSNLGVVSMSPAAVALQSAAVVASGSNPPSVAATSSYTVTVTASNPGGGSLTGASVTIPVPAGVTVTSPSTATGTISGSPLIWSIGTMLPGATATATFTANVTPSPGDLGMTMTLVSGQTASGTDAPASAIRTATAPAIVLGLVTDAPPPPTLWTVAFDSAGGSPVGDQSIADGEPAVQPADPTLSGFLLAGWTTQPDGGAAWIFGDPVTEAITLYAQWIAIPPAPITWAVAFDSTGGSSVSDQTIDDGSPVAEPVAPTRSGFVFEGWFTGPGASGTEWDFTTDLVGDDTTLFAHWTALPAVMRWLVFDSLGGTSVASQHLPDGAAASAPAAPVRDGFVFDGWFTAPTGGANWEFGTDTVSADTTLYARWTTAAVTPSWIVAFDAAGGTSVADQTVTDGGTATAPTAPTRAGFTFGGWFTAPTGGVSWDFAQDTVDGDTTLYAHWTAQAVTVVTDVSDLALTGGASSPWFGIGLVVGGVVLVTASALRRRPAHR